MALESDRPTPFGNDEPTTNLVRETVDLVRQLVRAEVALAKEELGRDAVALKVSVAAWAVAFTCVGFGLAMVLVSVGVALGWLVGLIVGVALVVMGGIRPPSGSPERRRGPWPRRVDDSRPTNGSSA